MGRGFPIAAGGQNQPNMNWVIHAKRPIPTIRRLIAFVVYLQFATGNNSSFHGFPHPPICTHVFWLVLGLLPKIHRQCWVTREEFGSLSLKSPLIGLRPALMLKYRWPQVIGSSQMSQRPALLDNHFIGLPHVN